MILSTRFESSLVLVELLISSVMQWMFVHINTCTFASKIVVSTILEYMHINFLKFLNFLFMQNVSVNNTIFDVDFFFFFFFLQFHVRCQSLPEKMSQHVFCNEPLSLRKDHYIWYGLSDLNGGYRNVQVCQKIPFCI